MEGSTKVPPRLKFLNSASSNVAEVSWCLCFWGANPFWGAKNLCGRFPISSLNLSRSSSTLFCIFFNSVSLGIFSHSKVLGATWHFCLSHLLGSKLRDLFTCLTHTNSVRRKRPIMLLLGCSLGPFFYVNKGFQTRHFQVLWMLWKPLLFSLAAHEKAQKKQLRKVDAFWRQVHSVVCPLRTPFNLHGFKTWPALWLELCCW